MYFYIQVILTIYIYQSVCVCMQYIYIYISSYKGLRQGAPRPWTLARLSGPPRVSGPRAHLPLVPAGLLFYDNHQVHLIVYGWAGWLHRWLWALSLRGVCQALVPTSLSSSSLSSWSRATASPTSRRASRRRRALARQAWHLHCTGAVRLSAKRLRTVFTVLHEHHSRDWHFLRLIAAEMASTGWLCGTCRKMRSPNAWYCDLCGGNWEEWRNRTWRRTHFFMEDAPQEPQAKNETEVAKEDVTMGARTCAAGLSCPVVSRSGPWSTAYVQDQKGSGKGLQNVQMAAPPPPPPPMLMSPPPMHGVPWMQAPMPMMQHMPFMPPQMDFTAAQPPQQMAPEAAEADEQRMESKCTKEAEQDHEGCQKRREFVAGVSVSRADREEKGRQGRAPTISLQPSEPMGKPRRP